MQVRMRVGSSMQVDVCGAHGRSFAVTCRTVVAAWSPPLPTPSPLALAVVSVLGSSSDWLLPGAVCVAGAGCVATSAVGSASGAVSVQLSSDNCVSLEEALRKDGVLAAWAVGLRNSGVPCSLAVSGLHCLEVADSGLAAAVVHVEASELDGDTMVTLSDEVCVCCCTRYSCEFDEVFTTSVFATRCPLQSASCGADAALLWSWSELATGALYPCLWGNA